MLMFAVHCYGLFFWINNILLWHFHVMVVLLHNLRHIIKWIVFNKGIYIDSYCTDAVIGISLRLGLVSFTKTPQNLRFAFCFCYIR